MELTRTQAAVLEFQYLSGGAPVFRAVRALADLPSTEVEAASWGLARGELAEGDEPLLGWRPPPNEPKLRRPQGITPAGIRALREHAKRWGAEGGLALPGAY